MLKDNANILVVDDEPAALNALNLILGDNLKLSSASSGEEALEFIKTNPVDLVFLDISLPGINGFETLRQIKQHEESLEVVMLTADEKAKSAMRAIEMGAFYYVTKPFGKDDIILLVSRILERRKLLREIVSLQDEMQHPGKDYKIISQHKSIQALFEIIRKVAPTDSTVLITGESGTGKELIARAIHAGSPRKQKHFKAIHCGAVSETLLESELFGYEKGAFTGATARKIGKFEMADGGTLFLDEISSMSEAMQVKLLRVLQEQEIERVGGLQTIPIDVRIVAATNCDLKEMVEQRRFREDLYYRIHVVNVEVPPLRKREGDVALLAEYYLKFYAEKFRKCIIGFSNGAINNLRNYCWPGNVRELKNVIERAVVLCEKDQIDIEHLPLNFATPKIDISQLKEINSLKKIMDRYEREIIMNVLERTDWNQTKTAEILGIHRNTLLAKLDSLNLDIKQLKKTAV